MPPKRIADVDIRMEKIQHGAGSMESFGDYVQERASASAATTLQTAKVPKGKLFRSLTICAIDLTSAIATSIELGIISNTAKKPIDCTPGSFVAGQSHTIRFPCILEEGQRIYATFNNATSGDALVLSVHGILIDKDDYCAEGDL